MADNPGVEERRERFAKFVAYRQEHLRGDEKGEAQVFLDRLFQAFGHAGAIEAGAKYEERVKTMDQGGTSFADLVWKPRVLVEMKKAGVDLAKHYRQAFRYWERLVPDRPQFVVTCNFDELWIYDLNHQMDEPVDRVAVKDLPQRWEAMAFLLPDQEKPVFQNDLVAVTRDSAAQVAEVFNALVERGVDRHEAERFVLQCVMAMFAEDIGLLPSHAFTRAIDDALAGESAYDLVFGLFKEMDTEGQTPHGRYEGTPHFNGGLFRKLPRFELERKEVQLLKKACEPDWSKVSPVVFGTLFEQSMEEGARHAYGAHYTSEIDIQKVVGPTIVEPWRERIEAATTMAELGQVEQDLLEYKVLDPACGSGNFLYVAYRELRRLEAELREKVQARSRRPEEEKATRLSFVSPTQFFGIEINDFAVEIAKVTLMLARKLAADELGDEHNVLPLDDLDDNIKTADALEADWPEFDACISNPPYLGRRRIVEDRGADYSAWLAEAFPDVGGVSDYVVYWFRKAHRLLPEGGRAGLVGTNSIRQTDTRKASLDFIVDNGGVIYNAVSSQPWSGDAQVMVSIVNWIKDGDVEPKVLWIDDGKSKLEVEEISGSLSAEIDLRAAVDLDANKTPKRTFQGQTPGHEDFVLAPEQAQEIIDKDPKSAEVIHPYFIGQEFNDTGLPSRYLIDIPAKDAVEAAEWPGALEWVRQHVLPKREAAAAKETEANEAILDKRAKARVNWHHRNFLEHWWQLSYRREAMLRAIADLPRYIAISRVAVISRQSVYAYVAPEIRPGDAMQVFAFADDYSLGILHSTYHRLWFEGRCSTLKKDLRYTAGTVFNSFPWPQAPTEETVAGVVDSMAAILDYRDEKKAEGMQLGEQYATLRDPGQNRLRELHKTLDRAVREAYGFEGGGEPLAQLLALNESIGDGLGDGLARGPGDVGIEASSKSEGMIVAPGADV